MALTRKFVRSVLEKLTSSDDYTSDQAVEDILAEHGATLKVLKDRLDEFDDIDVDTYRSDREKYDSYAEKLGDRKLDDVLSENDTLKRQISDSSREKLVDEVVKDFKFKDKYAEEAVRSEIRTWDVVDDGSAFVDVETKVEKLKEDFKDAFVEEDDRPRRISVARGTTGDSDSSRLASATYLERRKRELGLTK